MAVMESSGGSSRSLLAGLVAIGFVYFIVTRLTTHLRRRRMAKENDCLPVPRWPALDRLFGIDVLRGLIKDSAEHRALEGFHEKFKIMKSNTFKIAVGGKEDVFTIEPENLKTVLSLKFKDYSLGEGRALNFMPCLGPGIFTNNGAEWTHSREMLRPNFARDRVRDLDSFESHVKELMENIPTDGSEIDLCDLFFRLTMDASTELLFGESTRTLSSRTEQASGAEFALAFNRAQDFMSWLIRYGRFKIFLSHGQFKKDTKVIHDFVDKYVDKGLARREKILSEPKSDHYLFLDEIVRQTTDRYRIRSELLNILLAGRDTTASLLSNVWWTLARNPQMYARLRQEVSTLDGRQPTFDELREMKFLQAVLKESLRLHPQVPWNFREALVDTVLPLGGGKDGLSPCLVPKGTNVSWSNYAMHRRTDMFGPDAEVFRPERWLEDGLRPGWEYLPFNGGPRVCLGQQFALNEAGYTTARLVQEFSALKPMDPEEPWREMLTLTCVNLGGCKVSMTPATAAH